jgi:hypothetical protein
MVLYIIIILLLICFTSKFFNKFTEKFTSNYNIVGYNNLSLPIKIIPSIYDNETIEITKLLDNIFKVSNCDFDLSKYTIYSTYIEFPFNNIIKKMIADYIKNNIDTFTNDKIEINSDINHLYWKNEGDDRLFIFNVNLLNNTRFMVRNIQVKILIKNIKKFMNDNDYKTNIPAATLISSTDILCIKLDTDNYLRNTDINGFDKLKEPYYQIKNKLFLMDPFLTSGDNIKVTYNMKTLFKEQIKIREELMKTIKK